jgi:hypothetical protein
VLEGITCGKIGLVMYVWEEQYLEQGPEATFSFWVAHRVLKCCIDLSD